MSFFLRKYLFRPFPLVFLAAIGFLLVCGGIPGYRDGSFFYAPLFEYLRQELIQGHLPLWNPYEDLGQPLATNPTTMFFYPVTQFFLLVSLLPGFDSLTAYTGFVGFHVLLALLLAYRLARRWHCGPEAASLAAFCYAIGGNVLFQWHNVPFLVGAAWLPEAFLQAERMTRSPGAIEKIRHATAFGVVLALMTLGGDPHLAYNAVICSAVFFCFSPEVRRFVTRKRGGMKLIRNLFVFFIAGTVSLLLAAVLVLPGWELRNLSDRSQPGALNSTFFFSVPPWRILEFFWPNAGGWQLPIHLRWLHALSNDVLSWTPSHYQGLLPALTALIVLYAPRDRGSRFFRRYRAPLSLLLIFFLLASVGNWFYLYRLLLFLPGYDTFRYPAKLLIVVSLLMAIFFAFGFDRLFRDDRFRQKLRRGLKCFFVPVVLAAGLALFFPRNTLPVISCTLFGPFDEVLARRGLLVTSFGVALMLILLLILTGRRIPRRLARPLLMVVVVADLTLANSWLLPSIPYYDPSAIPPVALEIDRTGVAPPRVYRFPTWFPPEYMLTSSKDRAEESCRWNRASMYPRHQMPLRINNIETSPTLTPKEYARTIRKLRRLQTAESQAGKQQTEENMAEFEKILADLGVQYVIAPLSVRLRGKRLYPGRDLTIDVSRSDWPSDVAIWKIRDPRPRNYLRFEPNLLEFEVSLEEPATVSVPEQFWPGWKALLEDGGEVRIRPVESVFRGVDLPAGEHRVTMIYDPPLLRIGAFLSLLGMLLSLTLFFGLARLKKG